MDIYKPHLNTPPHWFVSDTIYMVTGATLYKEQFLDSDAKRANFCETLLERAKDLNWSMKAWAIMPNHYHFIAQSPENAISLKILIQGIHSINAKLVNQIDQTPGRRVWYNYWDTCIRTEQSYYARMNYVTLNPVKHELVENPEDYPFSSYGYLLKNTEPEFQKLVLSQSIAGEKIEDDF